MAHKNEKLLRSFDEAMSRGDVDTMRAAFTEDVVVHIGGRNKMAGVYKGIDELFQSYARFMEVIGPDAQFDTHEIIANDAHGVVLQTLRATRDGQRIEIPGVGIFHFRDGKISEAWFADIDPYTADPFYDAGM